MLHLLSKPIIAFSFKLASSARYRGIKRFFYNLLNNDDYPPKKFLDIVMISLIVLSVGILVYEVRHEVPSWLLEFDIYGITLIFLLEYLLRLWVHDDLHRRIVEEHEKAQFLGASFRLHKPILASLATRLRYMATPAMIIDLLAIVPAYRPLRLLRIFVLFRLFKLLRYTKSINRFIEVVKTKRFELYTLLFMLTFIVFVAGIAIYLFEVDANEDIDSLFDALYWALVTISTVGYGDISPVTTPGRAVTIIIIISGIAMISFVTSVIVSAFSERLDELKEERIVEKVSKSNDLMLIYGFGELTQNFLMLMKRRGGLQDYVIIEKDPTKLESARKITPYVISADPTSEEILVRLGIAKKELTVLALMDDEIENLYITLHIKSYKPTAKVIALAFNDEMVGKLKLAKCDDVVHPSLATSQMLQAAIAKPALFQVLRAMLTGHNVAKMHEIYVDNSSALIGKEVGRIDFKRYKLLFLGIQRGGIRGEFYFKPAADFVIEKEDVLIVMGLSMSVEFFIERLAKGAES